MSIARKSFECAGAVTQYAACALDASGKLVVATATGDAFIGFAQDAGAIGDRVSVIVAGESFAFAAAAGIAASSTALTADLAGALVAYVGPGYQVGRVLFNENQASAAGGDKIRVYVNGVDLS